MGIEVRPLGVKCNIQCRYCYQEPQRDAGNASMMYDLPKLKKAVEEAGRAFTLFGGEPLLAPIPVLRELLEIGLRKYGGTDMQTNGTLIKDAHIELFREFRVAVGVSVDGPDELNDVRWAGSLAKTREATAKTHAAIKRLCEEGFNPTVIITLHRGNATAEHLPRMVEWLRELDAMGVKSARLHILEVEDDDEARGYALTDEENIAAFMGFAALEKELKNLSLDVFNDMRNMLAGDDTKATCIWKACDSYTTRAVRGIEGNGQSSNCGRTNKDGVDYVKSPQEGFERYISLYHTPYEYGGCKDCRFFLMCKGQCPGTAIDGDWRNRTRDCRVWLTMYETLEQEALADGQVPLSLDPVRKQVENHMLAAWWSGRNPDYYQSVLDARAALAAPQNG
jgi:uncharacterized protein